MKLGDILRTAGTCRQANLHPVTFRIVGRADNFLPLVGEARACFCYVPEDERSQAVISARKAVAERFKGDEEHVRDSDVRDETTYQILLLALRDSDPDSVGRHPPFATSVDELRSALVLSVAQEMWEEYQRYLAEEFPAFVDKETWEALVADAKKGCLTDLLTEYGSGKRRQALISLVVHSGESLTPTSGAGEPSK